MQHIINALGVIETPWICLLAWFLYPYRSVHHVGKTETTVIPRYWPNNHGQFGRFMAAVQYRKFASIDWFSHKQRNYQLQNCKLASVSASCTRVHFHSTWWFSLDGIIQREYDCGIVILAIIFHRSLFVVSSMPALWYILGGGFIITLHQIPLYLSRNIWIPYL